LLPRTPGVDMHGITLRVLGDHIAVPVPVAEDNTFVLPRNAQALDEDAAVVANRKTTSMTWRAQVITPGLPPGTRRLGDLRLECLVGMEAGPGVEQLAAVRLDLGCADQPGTGLQQPGRQLPVLHGAACLLGHPAAGARSEVLPFRMLYAGGEQTPRHAAVLRLPGAARPHLLRADLGPQLARRYPGQLRIHG
jgi:hypothetical protein